LISAWIAIIFLPNVSKMSRTGRRRDGRSCGRRDIFRCRLWKLGRVGRNADAGKPAERSHPCIKPDGRVSRIRLSGVVHRGGPIRRGQVGPIRRGQVADFDISFVNRSFVERPGCRPVRRLRFCGEDCRTLSTWQRRVRRPSRSFGRRATSQAGLSMHLAEKRPVAERRRSFSAA
jgi:hypothetical protein